MKTTIKAGKYLVLRKDGKPIFAKKFGKNKRVEHPDNIEAVEKSSLTADEKKKEK